MTKRTRRAATAVAVVLSFLAVTTVTAGAAPAAPAEVARYHGSVTYYSLPAQEGLLVSAQVGPQVVATAPVTMDPERGPVYALAVGGDDPDTPEKEGPAENDILTFRVNGVPADQLEFFNAGEDRAIDLTVSKIEVCLGAYDDRDRDLAKDPGEPWLSGVTINLRQFFVVRSYTTTGLDEPSCASEIPADTTVQVVDWPSTYDPPTGGSVPEVVITQRKGVFGVQFPFVDMGSSPGGPTNTPAGPTATAVVYQGPTGQTPLPTATPTITFTPSVTFTPLPSDTPTATSAGTATGTPTGAPSATESPTPTPSATRTPTPSVTPTPAKKATLIVNSAADPGTVGDALLTLREAIQLAVGDLALSSLSLAERGQVSGAPGADSADTIRFAASVFPADTPAIITVQPPSTDAVEGMGPAALAARPGLPPLSTGLDAVDGVDRGVVLSAGISATLFDGIVITSDGNTVQGLELRNFNTAVLVTEGASQNTIGGKDTGQGNIIVNNITGVGLSGAGVDGNVVYGNLIGVDRSGAGAAGNATHGVLVEAGASSNHVGGPGGRNTISANFLDGVAVIGPQTNNNLVQGNFIGTNAAGSAALANGTGVVVSSGAVGTVIGGVDPNTENVISGNSAEGVWIQSAGTAGTVVQGNLIGLGRDRVTALPNGGTGVLITDGAQGNLVGGSDLVAGNQIEYNGGSGVIVRGAATLRNTIRHNSITANAGLGISLENGGNKNLAAPVITRQTLSSAEGVAPPNSIVEIFSDPVNEGAVFEGSTVSDGNGYFIFRAFLPFTGPYLTATATDADGNTSPFGLRGTAPPTPTPSATPTLPRPTSVPGPGLAFLPYLSQHAALRSVVSVDPAQTTLDMGQITDVAVSIADVTGLYSGEIVIGYDSGILEVLDENPALAGIQVAPGEFPPAGRVLVASNQVTPGEIHYVFTLVDAPAVDGSGALFHFRWRGRAPGVTTVQFLTAQFLNDAADRIGVAARGVQMHVLQPPTGTPRPSASPGPTRTNTAVPTVTHTVPPTAVPTALPTWTFTPVPTVTRTATWTPVPTATRTATHTPGPTATHTPTSPPTNTPTASHTPPPTNTPLPTATPSETPVPSDTPVPSETAVPSQTPIASDTPVPTNTPPPTVTPVTTPDGCVRPLVNGGFETTDAWVLGGARLPRYVDYMVHSGQQSILLGIVPGEPNELSYSSIWQGMHVPDGARTMSISAWTYQAAQPGGGPDRQLMLVYDTDPGQNLSGRRAPLAYVFGERVNADAWQRRTLTLDVAAYRGRDLWLYSSAVNDGLGGRVWMVLDDIEVKFCP